MPDGAPRDVPRPEARAERRDASRPRRFRLAPGRTLLTRILIINAVGLGLLVGGVLYLNQFREGLIGLRAEALRTQGAVIAIAVAEASGLPGALGVDPVRANLVLRRLARPAGVRARLYDRSGRLIGDTRSFSDGGGGIEADPLPPPGETPPVGWLTWLVDRYGDVVTWLTGPTPLYREVPLAGIAREREVYAALEGVPNRTVRANSDGELIVSVALPV
jgi:two-component system sensor histidine kinase ChvG